MPRRKYVESLAKKKKEMKEAKSDIVPERIR